MRTAVLDPATGKRGRAAGREIRDYCWSPGGEWITYTWREDHAGRQEDLKTRETFSHLVV